jgi:hypothetical protein
VVVSASLSAAHLRNTGRNNPEHDLDATGNLHQRVKHAQPTATTVAGNRMHFYWQNTTQKHDFGSKRHTKHRLKLPATEKGKI